MAETPYSTAYDPDTSTLTVSGSIGELDVVRLHAALAQGGRECDTEMVVDLSAVEFMPSLAIGALVGAWRDCTKRGVRLRVVAEPGTPPYRVLNICGLLGRFRVAVPD